jgi:hypothetical protein
MSQGYGGHGDKGAFAHPTVSARLQSIMSKIFGEKTTT